MKKIRKIKEMRPKVSSHLNVGTTANSITCTNDWKTLKRKRAKRQKQQADPPAENSSAPRAFTPNSYTSTTVNTNDMHAMQAAPRVNNVTGSVDAC
ncbi:hypothetical protein GH733_009050 [Mirounga leonina]|nr:hypothetical protein GH733_009050 [Mirounga leonina]